MNILSIMPVFLPSGDVRLPENFGTAAIILNNIFFIIYLLTTFIFWIITQSNRTRNSYMHREGYLHYSFCSDWHMWWMLAWVFVFINLIGIIIYLIELIRVRL